MLFLSGPLFAGQREVLKGNVTIAPDTAVYDYLFQFQEGREPFVALVSELSSPGVLKTFPDQRFEVERQVFISSAGLDVRSPLWPKEAGRGTVLRLLPSELLAPQGEPLSPERWAGANTGLHPTLHENQPFEVAGPTDYDGDGVTDELDAFPADPAESADNDHDGTGDQADPDDDNDGMPDLYEADNHLDALVNDAQQDPDNDGFTNGEESAAGTAARDGSSYFHITSAQRIPPDRIKLTWDALPGRRYEVWHRPQLSPRGTRVELNLRVPAPGPLSVTVDAGTSGDFFFVLVIPDPL